MLKTAPTSIEEELNLLTTPATWCPLTRDFLCQQPPKPLMVWIRVDLPERVQAVTTTCPFSKRGD